MRNYTTHCHCQTNFILATSVVVISYLHGAVQSSSLYHRSMHKPLKLQLVQLSGIELGKFQLCSNIDHVELLVQIFAELVTHYCCMHATKENSFDKAHPFLV